MLDDKADDQRPPPWAGVLWWLRPLWLQLKLAGMQFVVGESNGVQRLTNCGDFAGVGAQRPLRVLLFADNGDSQFDEIGCRVHHGFATNLDVWHFGGCFGACSLGE